MLSRDRIFIVGVGRSGTSLLQNMLNANSRICCLPETSFLRRYVASGRFEKLQQKHNVRRLADELVADAAFKRLGIRADIVTKAISSNRHISGTKFYDEISRLYTGIDGECRFIGDKDPRLIEYLPMLHEKFPDARVIHIFRDPRDVVLSKSKAGWSKNRSILVNSFAGRVQWSLAKRTGIKLLGSRFYELAYEDLISDPERELAAICRFLGVEFEESMLSPGAGGRTLVAADELPWKKESLGPILTDNSGNWRTGLAPEETVLCEAVSTPMMQDVEYEFSSARNTIAFFDKVWIFVQSLCVAFLDPVYCWYRQWQQRK